MNFSVTGLQQKIWIEIVSIANGVKRVSRRFNIQAMSAKIRASFGAKTYCICKNWFTSNLKLKAKENDITLEKQFRFSIVERVVYVTFHACISR